ncbi:MAG: glycosyltransferase family 39 protein [Anaerolineae bacterium]|nr:glycosyltransferase family 39 protein [Anaerolineae bacterium]
MPVTKLRLIQLNVMLLLAVLLGMILVMLSARWGPGINPDSANYIGAARNILAGHGVTMPTPDGPGAYTLFAPLYPIALALMPIGGDPVDKALWLNLLSMAVNIALVSYLTYRCTNNRMAALAAAVLVLTAANILRAHSLVMSEAPFITVSLLSWLFLTRYIHGKRYIDLGAAALFTLLGFGLRYAGAGLVGANMLCILLLSRERWPKRLLDTVIFALISALPVYLWMQAASSGDGVRDIFFNPIPLRQLLIGVFTYARWGFAEGLIRAGFEQGDGLALIIIIALSLAALALAIAVWRYLRRERHLPALRAALTQNATLPLICVIYAVTQYPFFVLVISALDAYTYIDERQLVAAHAGVIIAGAYGIFHVLRYLPRGSWLRRGVQMAVATLVVSYSVQGLVQTLDDYNDGQVFVTEHWRTAQTIEFLRDVPQEIPLYANNPEAVYLLAERTAYHMPFDYHFASLKPNDKLEAEMQLMKERLSAGDGYVVFFTNNTRRPHQISEEYLQEQLTLELVLSAPDGRIYRLSQ